MDIEDFACSAPPSEPLQGIENCVRDYESGSPVDTYLKSTRAIIRYGTAEQLSELDKLGGLLFLGLVSATEGYFRSTLSAALEICPICRSKSAEKSINLGGVLWHGTRDFRRSAFEHMSFTSSKEIKSAAASYLDVQLKEADFGEVFISFDSLCHLRHGLIHNDGVLPGRNAVQIDVPRRTKQAEIHIDFSFLQDSAASMHALVMTFNRVMFRQMCTRWATSWRMRSDWNPESERAKFLKIWNLFLCRTELERRPGKSSITPNKCIIELKREFDL